MLQNPLVSEAGFYTLTATDPANGCTSTDNAEVTLDNVVPVVTAIDAVLGCNDANTTIQATVTPIGSTLSWTGPNGFSSPNEDAVVSDLGMYTLTATSLNGCVNSANAFVTLGNDLPEITLEGATLTCTAQSATLQATLDPAGFSVSWTGPNGFASTDEDPLVTEPGLYILTATSSNGCTNTASVEVEQDISSVSAGAGVDGILSCTTTSVQSSAVASPLAPPSAGAVPTASTAPM
ncbi:MAG: hypothetical protein IPK99_05545 [Flavobacteriales bacterium]|nr:hypothetical protein [Flavobacteriales bacterium]